MGIQSTLQLTRRQAEERYVEKKKTEVLRRVLAEAVVMADEELCAALEEEFFNFQIITG